MYFLETIIYCYENITPFQASMLLSVAFLYVLFLFFRDKDVPPGPRGVPLFGYWPFLKTADSCHLHLAELTKKYGDLYSMRVAGTLFIHLGSIKAVKEVHLSKADNFDRFSGAGVLVTAFGDGLAFLHGEQFQVLRKFFLAKLREFGMNTFKENLADTVHDTLAEFVEELRCTEGSPFEISDAVVMKSMMVLRRVIFNDQGMTEDKLQELNDLYREIMKAVTSTNLLLIGPFAKYVEESGIRMDIIHVLGARLKRNFIFPFMPAVWKLKPCIKRMEEIFAVAVDQHKAEYNSSRIADVIDSYLKEREDRRNKGDPTAAYFTDRALISSIAQFMTDGAMTIAVVLENIFQKLVERSEEQGKIYQEIVEVIGTDRRPTLEDKTKLPYANAFIYEVARYSEFFPLFTSMECIKETTVRGYKIPEGAITLMNFLSAHRNPLDFENPNEFNPSRYLPSPGKKRPELPIIFGIGKRSCIGEAFSVNQMFLYLTTIVQNFRLTLPEGKESASTNWWSADKFRVCAHPRHTKSH